MACSQTMRFHICVGIGIIVDDVDGIWLRPLSIVVCDLVTCSAACRRFQLACSNVDRGQISQNVAAMTYRCMGLSLG